MLKILITVALVMLALDMIYLSLITGLFNKMFINIQGSPITVKYLPALLAYGLLIFGLYYFIIKNNRSLLDAFIFGLVIYGVYDATNMATIKNWQWNALFIDSIWGGILMMTTYYLTKKINKI